ncbi:putative non-specific serine/threonine protein kinase [Helianthus annuus]|nr:putative non-specific serine/threonine protein kinase [Helianthus annuus]
METNFLLIFTFLFFQRFGLSIITTSTNVTCIETERQSLLVFKQSITDTYNVLSTWRGLEYCEWHGVGCDRRKGHVVKLDLGNRAPLNMYTTFSNDKYLTGELSPSLQNLKHLRYLDLSMNRFLGNIPEFIGSFERLEYLNLSGSFSSGVVPHHLGNLSRLQYLDLRYFFVINNFYETVSIQFQSPIVDDLGWVSSLSSLRYLDLSGIYIGKDIDWLHPVNMLSSLLTLKLAQCNMKIPSVKHVNFTSLNSLDLSFNDIDSSIPVWLSNLTGLMHLNLHHNDFHGKIPDFIGILSNLASIDFSFNSFDGSMPDMLCNLSNLVHLSLAWNMLSGHIPASLGILIRLEDLYLCGNQLSEKIPMNLWQLSNLKSLDLSNNSFVGVLCESHFAKLKNLNTLMLSGNWLVLNFSSRWIPPFQLRTFGASSCNIGPHFPNWLHTQTNLQALDISYSGIRDTIPKWFENIVSHISYLDLSNNQITGKLPRIHGHGNKFEGMFLKMNSNKFEGSLTTFPTNVQILDLSDNLLSGHVPQTDATMNPSLEVVNLSKNRFTGSIPVHLCKVPSITVLDLSQNKFYGKLPGCLGNLINLIVMDISNNAITGVIPSSLGSLRKLESLHLHNNRVEGYLPLSLQNLTSLITLDTGNNFLRGRIPFWIGESLLNLNILNLQSNKFTGKIPLQLCQLSALQHLNLAQNNIIGTIPHCFSNLSRMIINQDDLLEYINENYEENTLATIKGIQLVYTKTLKFLTTIDLSSNNITGEIPDVLMNLVGLNNLNLSRNQLKGQIPRMIGNLSNIESLDLSMNMLSGQIPQSLIGLNFLSYLNLSFNNLSGAIPVGKQLQTLMDPSIYEGNSGLCGPPVSSSCKGHNSSHNHVVEDEGQDDDEGLWFYSGVGSGFVAGFMGLVGSLYVFRTWRLSYFMILENVYGWLNVLVLLNLARLRRKCFRMIG